METKKYPSGSDSAAEGDHQRGNTMPDLPAPEALDRIRSILFGEEVKKNDLRHSQLSDLVNTGLSALRGDIDTQLRSLEDKIEQTAKASLGALKDESTVRTEETGRIEGLLAEVDARTGNRMSATEARVDEVAAIAHKELLEARSEVSSSMDYQIEQLKSVVDDAVSKLAHGKADKQALAEWFDQLSSRLRD